MLGLGEGDDGIMQVQKKSIVKLEDKSRKFMGLDKKQKGISKYRGKEGVIRQSTKENTNVNRYTTEDSFSRPVLTKQIKTLDDDNDDNS